MLEVSSFMILLHCPGFYPMSIPKNSLLLQGLQHSAEVQKHRAIKLCVAK